MYLRRINKNKIIIFFVILKSQYLFYFYLLKTNKNFIFSLDKNECPPGCTNKNSEYQYIKTLVAHVQAFVLCLKLDLIF